jgi:hypothetical protein
LRSRKARRPSRSHHALVRDEALGSRAKAMSVEKVRFDVEVRKEQRVLEHVADPAPLRR